LSLALMLLFLLEIRRAFRAASPQPPVAEGLIAST